MRNLRTMGAWNVAVLGALATLGCSALDDGAASSLSASGGRGDTVGDVSARSGTCDTTGFTGLTKQLIDEMNRLAAGARNTMSNYEFPRLEELRHTKLRPSGAHVFLYLQPAARTWLLAAIEEYDRQYNGSLDVHSMYRSYVAQWHLQRKGCNTAVAAGHSSHEVGLAFDSPGAANDSHWKAVLAACGWHNTSTNHFVFRGDGDASACGLDLEQSDSSKALAEAQSLLAFKSLCNRSNDCLCSDQRTGENCPPLPLDLGTDRIETLLSKAPAEGFQDLESGLRGTDIPARQAPCAEAAGVCQPFAPEIQCAGQTAASWSPRPIASIDASRQVHLFMLPRLGTRMWFIVEPAGSWAPVVDVFTRCTESDCEDNPEARLEGGATWVLPVEEGLAAASPGENVSAAIDTPLGEVYFYVTDTSRYHGALTAGFSGSYSLEIQSNCGSEAPLR